MIQIAIPDDFHAWRSEARRLLEAAVKPGEVSWVDANVERGLFEELLGRGAPQNNGTKFQFTVPGEFLTLAERVAAHRDARRWSVLYSVLHRLTHGNERHLLRVQTDPDVHQLAQWGKAIGRDIHKMHAFVRFRLTGIDEETGRENFVSWFEPEHRIVKLAAPFFRKRFAAMNWAILTPDDCVSWDGEAIHFSPGLPRSAAPGEDELDDLWRTYYRSIFNPARLKLQAMQSEMPKKYWKNLPETQILTDLIEQSSGRVRDMMDTPERDVKRAPANSYLESLHTKNESES